uniref:Uncharacterized protein n=1 Tax=Dromaius novaehollandiae TaxID=8790 RepID=A0A8C4JG63_DRONO
FAGLVPTPDPLSVTVSLLLAPRGTRPRHRLQIALLVAPSPVCPFLIPDQLPKGRILLVSIPSALLNSMLLLQSLSRQIWGVITTIWLQKWLLDVKQLLCPSHMVNAAAVGGPSLVSSIGLPRSGSTGVCCM